MLPFSAFGIHCPRKPSKGYVEAPKTLGEMLRNKRLERCLFQKEVALLLDVSEDTITYWENGRTSPLIKYYPKIIEFLGYVPIEINSTTLSGRITLYRYMNGVSYKELGILLGVDGTTVRSWELKQFIPSKSTLNCVWKWFSKNLKTEVL